MVAGAAGEVFLFAGYIHKVREVSAGASGNVHAAIQYNLHAKTALVVWILAWIEGKDANSCIHDDAKNGDDGYCETHAGVKSNVRG